MAGKAVIKRGTVSNGGAAGKDGWARWNRHTPRTDLTQVAPCFASFTHGSFLTLILGLSISLLVSLFLTFSLAHSRPTPSLSLSLLPNLRVSVCERKMVHSFKQSENLCIFDLVALSEHCCCWANGTFSHTK